MEKETFRNLIIQSMERIDDDVYMYPVSLSELFVTMSAVIIHQAATLASPNGSTEPTYKDVFNVISCYDWARAALLSMQINRFISWLMEEKTDIDNEDGEIIWYDYGNIASKWNEFVKKENKKTMDGDSE